jgi:hypothetical protein
MQMPSGPDWPTQKNMPMGFNPIFLDAVYKKNIPPLLRFIFFRRAPAAAGASAKTRWVTGAWSFWSGLDLGGECNRGLGLARVSAVCPLVD